MGAKLVSEISPAFIEPLPLQVYWAVALVLAFPQVYSPALQSISLVKRLLHHLTPRMGLEKWCKKSSSARCTAPCGFISVWGLISHLWSGMRQRGDAADLC